MPRRGTDTQRGIGIAFLARAPVRTVLVHTKDLRVSEAHERGNNFGLTWGTLRPTIPPRVDRTRPGGTRARRERMQIQTHMKAGGLVENHNEPLVQTTQPATGLKVKTRVKAG